MHAIDRIFETLVDRDPGMNTISVGSAAIAVHLAEARIVFEPPADIDVLCSSDFFCSDLS